MLDIPVAAYGNAAAFLPPVLKGKQSIIGQLGAVQSVIVKNTEYAAFFPYMVFSLCLKPPIGPIEAYRPRRLNTSA